MNVLLTGASGLLGTALAVALQARGDAVRYLVRREPLSGDRKFRWEPEGNWVDGGAFKGVEAVIHLAGRSVASGRWSAAVKNGIRESRVLGTQTVVAAMRDAEPRPKVFLSASAVGYYGNRGDEWVDESAPPGKGFLGDVCQAWESAAVAAESAGIRVARMRFGHVLSTAGGALGKLLPVFRLGLGGPLADGRTWWSWISRPDVVRAILFLLDRDDMSGAFNMTAPEPVTNREMSRALGKVLRRPAVLPVPRFALQLVLGEMADEVLLSGCRAKPMRLAAAGFAHEDTEISACLRRLIAQKL
ncbi:MAG: TIGR01777 family protein [Thermogutta sp.]|nr:TIGR01777 family protein [Thermogutta sp.]